MLPTGPHRTAFSDFLAPTGYQFMINRLPKTSFAVQRVAIPSIALNAADEPTPFVYIPVEGNNLSFGDLRVQFIVDQDLANYLEIHNWLRALGHAEGFEEYAALRMEPGSGLRSAATMTVLDAKRNPIISVAFEDIVPIGLDQLEFAATTSGSSWQYILATATFRYKTYKIEREGV